MRIEVWFNNGLFRAFPEVNKKTIQKQDNFIRFKFKDNHAANINLDNVNFIEIMEEV